MAHTLRRAAAGQCRLLPALASSAGRVRLLHSADNAVHAEFAIDFSAALLGSAWRVVDAQAPAADLTVAVGSEALRGVLQQPEATPVLAVLVTRRCFERILAEIPPDNLRALLMTALRHRRPVIGYIRQFSRRPAFTRHRHGSPARRPNCSPGRRSASASCHRAITRSASIVMWRAR